MSEEQKNDFSLPEAPAIKMMAGSEGKENYFVIGETDQAKIGIRPLVNLGSVLEMPSVDLGFRIRVVPKNPSDTYANQMVKEQYPKAAFLKVDEHRASLLCFMQSPVPAGVPFNEFLTKITDIESMSKLVRAARGNLVGVSFDMADGDLVFLLSSKMMEIASGFKDAYESVQNHYTKSTEAGVAAFPVVILNQ